MVKCGVTIALLYNSIAHMYKDYKVRTTEDQALNSVQPLDSSIIEHILPGIAEDCGQM